MAVKDQLQLLREKLKRHEEILDHLQSAPENEALATFRRLRSTGNSENTLALISGRAGTTVRPSNIETARAIQPPTASQFEFELNMLHRFIYPALEPLNSKSVDLDMLFARSFRRRLTTEPFKHSNRIDSGEPTAITSSITTPRATPPLADKASGPLHVDARLSRLHVGYWTNVPIDDDFAASVLSHYLETDHPLWGCFDADLFLSDLVDHKLNACSPFLFNALMAHACVSRSIPCN
jgi:hypothetical protein